MSEPAPAASRSADDSQFEQITTDVADRVLTITLNRPERLNACTATIARELMHSFDRAVVDDEVRAILATGAGRCLCAGEDLASLGATVVYLHREHTAQ